MNPFWKALPFLFCLSANAIAQPENSPISEKQPHLPVGAMWGADPGGTLTVEEVWAKRAGFFSPNPPRQYVPKGNGGANYWFLVPLENLDADRPAERIFQWQGCPDSIAVFYQKEKGWGSATTGKHVPVQDLAYPPNDRLLPVELAPGERTNVLVKIKKMQKAVPRDSVGLALLPPNVEKEDVPDNWERNPSKVVFYGAFFAGVALLFLLTFYQLLMHPDERRTFVFYGLYLIGIFAFYFERFEFHLLKFPFLFAYFRHWHYELEAPLTYFIVFAYMHFVDSFLELKTRSPRHSRLIRRMSWLVVAIPVGHLFFSPFWGPVFNRFFFDWSRILLYTLILYFLASAILRNRSTLATIILVGTSFLVLPGILGLLDDTLGGFVTKSPSGLWLWYYASAEAIPFPYYDFKLGVLIELSCFSAGLTWKMRELKKKYSASLQSIEKEKAAKKRLAAENGALVARVKEEPYDDSAFLAQINEALEKNYDDSDFNVEALAKAMHITRGRLFDKLKEGSEHSPSELLRHFRIQKAKHLLSQPDLLVAEVAYRTGFKNANHFSKVFKKAEGISPREYRKGGEKGTN